MVKYLDSSLLRRFVSVTAMVLSPLIAGATAITEAPWMPVAAGYRMTLFLGNLEPLPWETLNDSWTSSVAGASDDTAPIALLAPSEADAVMAALNAKDRHALFSAATKAVRSQIRSYLDMAVSAPGTPEAGIAANNAQALYRAFEDGIRAADADNYRRIGLAWLELNSAVGSTGLLGVGQVEADTEKLQSSREVISGYLDTNYAPLTFTERRRLSSLPETAVLSDQTVTVPVALPPGSDIADQRQLPRLVLQFEEAGEDEKNLPLVAYGDMLFDSPVIFGGPARDLGISCSTCHNRSDVNRDFFIPGLSHRPGGMDVDGAFFNPLFNDRKDDHLDTPSLRGVRFTAPYGRDGRETSLRRFTRNVIVTEFAGKEPTPFQLDALVAYMREFDFLPNPNIDRSGRLTDSTSDAAKRGEEIFNTEFAGLGDRSCASCHTPDANFRDGITYDIGSAEPPFPGGTAPRFETPTLRNINFSAPYMHDGSIDTLEGVVAWFDETKSLNLSETGREDLSAYLRAVGDGEDPYQIFEGEQSEFRLAFDELTTFASTLNTLLPARDTENILILVDTVAPDLAADAGTMTNLRARPDVYALSDTLRTVGDAVAEGDWKKAEEYWKIFQSRQADLDARMF